MPQSSEQYLEFGLEAATQPGPKHWRCPVLSRTSPFSPYLVLSLCFCFCLCRRDSFCVFKEPNQFNSQTTFSQYITLNKDGIRTFLSNFFSRLLTCFTFTAFLRITGLKYTSSSSSLRYVCTKKLKKILTQKAQTMQMLGDYYGNVSNHAQQFGVKSCCLVLMVEFELTVIVIRVVSASVVRTVSSFTRRHFFFLYTQHFLHKEVEYFITGLRDQRPQTDKLRLDVAVQVQVQRRSHSKWTCTHPGPDLTLPKPALLSDFVWTSKLLHVLAKVTLSTVLCPSAGLTLPTHSYRPFHLRSVKQWR